MSRRIPSKYGNMPIDEEEDESEVIFRNSEHENSNSTGMMLMKDEDRLIMDGNDGSRGSGGGLSGNSLLGSQQQQQQPQQQQHMSHNEVYNTEYLSTDELQTQFQSNNNNVVMIPSTSTSMEQSLNINENNMIHNNNNQVVPTSSTMDMSDSHTNDGSIGVPNNDNNGSMLMNNNNNNNGNRNGNVLDMSMNKREENNKIDMYQLHHSQGQHSRMARNLQMTPIPLNVIHDAIHATKEGGQPYTFFVQHDTGVKMQFTFSANGLPGSEVLFNIPDNLNTDILREDIINEAKSMDISIDFKLRFVSDNNNNNNNNRNNENRDNEYHHHLRQQQQQPNHLGHRQPISGMNEIHGQMQPSNYNENMVNNMEQMQRDQSLTNTGRTNHPHGMVRPSDENPDGLMFMNTRSINRPDYHSNVIQPPPQQQQQQQPVPPQPSQRRSQHVRSGMHYDNEDNTTTDRMSNRSGANPMLIDNPEHDFIYGQKENIRSYNNRSILIDDHSDQSPHVTPAHHHRAPTQNQYLRNERSSREELPNEQNQSNRSMSSSGNRLRRTIDQAANVPDFQYGQNTIPDRVSRDDIMFQPDNWVVSEDLIPYHVSTKKPEVNVDEEPSGQFPCIRCDKRFRFHCFRLVHMVERHTLPQMNRANQCMICGLRGPTTTSQWLRHYAEHTHEKIYTCNFCNEGFTTPQIRAQHESSEHNPIAAPEEEDIKLFRPSTRHHHHRHHHRHSSKKRRRHSSRELIKEEINPIWDTRGKNSVGRQSIAEYDEPITFSNDGNMDDISVTSTSHPLRPRISHQRPVGHDEGIISGPIPPHPLMRRSSSNDSNNQFQHISQLKNNNQGSNSSRSYQRRQQTQQQQRRAKASENGLIATITSNATQIAAQAKADVARELKRASEEARRVQTNKAKSDPYHQMTNDGLTGNNSNMNMNISSNKIDLHQQNVLKYPMRKH
ncbi:hypothetical protein SNEBB_002206 [Seison nebaliae]|nr:hypothetical protein SNEBB_002206 [Seison nebaliae]